MPLSSRELDQLADNIYKDRRIHGSIYCGSCGYNLKTLPYVYTCPECGSSYNARPMLMKGIFVPHEARIPIIEFIAAVVCAMTTAYLVWTGLPTREVVSLTLALLLGAVALVFFDRALTCGHRFNVARKIARRIAETESRD